VVVAMRVLVTGAKGQVGQVILPGLVGHEVIATDKDTLDVTDRGAVKDAISGCDVVIHLAMTRGFTITWEDREWDTAREAFDSALFGTYNVLRAAAQFGKCVVLASSCCSVEFNSRGDYVTENYKPSGGGLYGCLKTACEHMADDLHRQLGLECTVVRIGGFAGFGEVHVGRTLNGRPYLGLLENAEWSLHPDDLRDGFAAITDFPSPSGWSLVHLVGDTPGRRWEVEQLWLQHRFRPHWGLTAWGDGRYDGRDNLGRRDIELVDAAIVGDHWPLPISQANAANSLALRWACSLGNGPAIKLLLKAGADPNALSGDPLRQAAASGDQDTLELLLDAQADPRLDGGEAVAWAAARGHSQMVDRCIQRLHPSREMLSAALYHSALAGRKDIMRNLLDAGADPNGENGESLRRAIIGTCAKSSEDAEMVQILLGAGCKQTPRNGYGYPTPLGTALQSSGNAQIVQLLLEHGADPDDVGNDQDPEAYVEAAVTKGHTEALALIGRDATGKKVTTCSSPAP